MKIISKTLFRALILVVIHFSTTVNAATLSDVAKEQRWADQVIDTLFDGEAIWLQTNPSETDQYQFLAIEMEADNDNGLAMIVVHGIGIHPNWEQVIQPIRVEMNERGWHTLSIQMPILENDKQPEDYAALIPESPARLQAAINYLKNKGARNIVIVAHSMGAAMSAYYLANAENSEAIAFVAIGMSNAASSLETVTIPVLDLYGSEDLPQVLEGVSNRLITADSAKKTNFQQVEVPDANHFFDDKEEQLITEIDQWLTTLPAISTQ